VYDDDEFDELPEWEQSDRLRWWDWAAVILSLPVAVLQAVTRWGEQVCVLLANHAGYKDEQVRARLTPVEVSR
jgi:hypothetical protein